MLTLSEMSFKAAQGLIPAEEVQSFLDKTNKVDHQITTLGNITNDLEEILADSFAHPGLRWRLDCLNKSLGSLRAGDFGFIFARPETGKTTFLASEITKMLANSRQAVVWLNNEEDGKKVMLRVYQAYFGVTLEQLMSNPRKYKQSFLEETDNKFMLFDSATIGRKDVENIVEKHSPQLVLYDQLDKIKGFQNDREDLRLGGIYQWARELAKGAHAAIGVCQADGHAEGVRYLTMEHVANAKTAKQAEADWILGIGKQHAEGQEYVRHLNISKNKLIGDEDTIPELRHSHFEVLIEPQIARYKDIVMYG